MGLEEIADELYGLPPEEFIGARDEHAATAKAAGDATLAKQVTALRRPTKAAWVANQLARQRRAELDGLLNLSAALGDAQRSLDGDQLRSLSTQRHQLVAAMSRAARGLAQQAGQPVSDTVEREVRDILEASLADPQAAEDLRRGRLTKSLSYAGFGPAAAADAKPQPRPAKAGGPDPRIRQAEQAVAEAEASAAQTLERQQAAEAAVEQAEADHQGIRAKVDELNDALESARREESTAAKAVREARNDQRAATRVAQGAQTRAEQARARLAKLRTSTDD